MKARHVAIVLALGVATVAHGDEIKLTSTAVDTLTPIETVATSDELTQVFGGSGSGSAVDNTIDTLSAITLDTSVPVAVQLRAINGLGQFPNEPAAHDQLTSLLANKTSTTAGAQVVLLRATIEALGTLAVLGHETPGDVDVLLPFLTHSSRDVRAVTARTLGQLCDTTAVTPLRAQGNQEASDQVNFEITVALRALGPGGACAI